LQEVVARLEEICCEAGWEQPPCVVGIERSGDIEMCFPPPSEDPLGDLVGYTAPDRWGAMGFLASGRVHDLAIEAGRMYGVERDIERQARIGHFVDRDGVAVSFLRLGDDPPDVRTGGTRGDRSDDVCRRALGLPTALPESPISLLWATRWLERVLDAAATSASHVATWPRVARHHVAVPAKAEAPDVITLIDLGRDVHEMGSWETLRSLVANGRNRVPNISPSAARWMDEGMFSRWMLEGMAPLGHLRTAVGAAVPAEVSASVDVVLGAWGLP